MSAAMEMPRYQSHKKVWALRIQGIVGHKLHFFDEGYAPIEVEPILFARYQPQPGDYYVVYEDGYKSFSPAAAFERGYSRIT
jgi:hypothetical protein